jgi:hypothetical protein
MMESFGNPGSGAQTLAAPRAARGEDLAAAGRGKTGTEAVTALAHQFAGLISPLHGWFSADPAIMPDIEVSPVMLAGPKRAVSGPKRAAPVEPGHRGQLARLIRERPVFVNLAAWRNCGVSGAPKSGAICPNLSISTVFFSVRMVTGPGGIR